MQQKPVWTIVDPRDMPVEINTGHESFQTSHGVLEAAGRMAAMMQDRLRTVIELLIVGVAFAKDEKTWTVISHEGVEIGRISNYLMSLAIAAMRDSGMQSTTLIDPNTGRSDGITFGFCYVGLDYEAMTARRHKTFVELS